MKPSIFKHTLWGFFCALFLSIQSLYAAENYAPWLMQIGLNESIVSAAKWGKGVKLGVVDTGIDATSPFFTKGQISNKLSSCAAVSFSCSNKYYDDHGHGTAVAAIAAGNLTTPWESNYGGYLVYANSVVSVAPNANIIAQKVLSASGSAYTTDVANGIIKAANAGASVINVSITYANTQDIVASINYAASKGAYIVWAGGNSGSDLLQNADTYGLSNHAINHLIFAGSVDASSTKSGFSNTPGSGSLNSADTKSGYAQHWLMTPGENILAPYNPSQPNAWAYWSGTSMSAPILSGSLVLLQSTWPILKTNGNAVNLLLATASDLGDAGIDSVYGAGLVNLERAFQPVGDLTIKDAKKKTISVNDLSGTMISSGALGKLSKVKSKLAKFTAFDSYQRNFSVNLSRLIQSPTETVSLNPLPSNVKTKPSAIKLNDGTVMTAWTEPQMTESDALNNLGEFGYNPNRSIENSALYFALDFKDGTNFSISNGYSTQFAYSKAFYGEDDLAYVASDLSTNAFAHLADGGFMVNYGTKINKQMRIAFAWNTHETDGDNNPTNTTLFHQSNRTNLIRMGLSYRANPQLISGLTLNYLTEKNGLIGSQLSEKSALGFSPNNKSLGIDFSLGVNLNEDNTFVLEKGVAFTKAAQGIGIVGQTSNIRSASLGGTFISKNIWDKNDALTISIKQPLSVTAGKAALTMASVDEMGYAQYKNEWVSLSPSGRETDYLISYEKNITPRQLLKLETHYLHNSVNINSNDDARVNFYYKITY